MTNDWHIVGVGDFDGNGRSDVLWRNDNGSLTLGEMNGTGIKLAHGLGTASTDWHIAAHAPDPHFA